MPFAYTIFNWKSIPLFFGVFAFAYDVNGVITDVYASLKVKKHFPCILKAYIAVMGVTVGVIGVIGYWGFRDSTKDMIFDNLIGMSWKKSLVEVFYSVSLLGSILLYVFPILSKID